MSILTKIEREFDEELKANVSTLKQGHLRGSKCYFWLTRIDNSMLTEEELKAFVKYIEILLEIDSRQEQEV